MQEYEYEVLKQYNIEILSTRKTRGAILCDTDRGLLLLKEVHGSEKRIPVLCSLYVHLFDQGFDRVDQIVPTREGEWTARSDDGNTYMLKRWFQGRECDVKKPVEILAASGNLAKLHIALKNSEICKQIQKEWLLKDEYIRHNKELKKVRKFIRASVAKGEFEYAFLNCFEQMYQWAQIGVSELENEKYERLFCECIEKGCLVHGEYNYHNVIMIQGDPVYKKETDRIATVNFEKVRADIQVEDFYYFLRKVMEKHGWKVRLGDGMLNAYSAIRPLTDEELDYIRVRLVYPEKFWKTADSYYRSNKAWISAKNTEKLETAIRQTEEKRRFLQEIFSFHL